MFIQLQFLLREVISAEWKSVARDYIEYNILSFDDHLAKFLGLYRINNFNTCVLRIRCLGQRLFSTPIGRHYTESTENQCLVWALILNTVM